MKYSKGICWLDDTRIPFVDSDKETINFDRPRIREKKDWVYDLGTTWENPDVKEYNTQGRFTPNLLVCDDMLNDGSISKSQRGRNDVGKPTYTGNSLLNSKTTMNNTDRGFDDKGSSSRYYDLDKWFDKVIDSL
jgi:hypothetical protein